VFCLFDLLTLLFSIYLATSPVKSVFKPSIWLVLLAFATLAACNRTPKAIDPASATAAKQQFDILRDSVDTRWSRMITSDDAKITATSQMLNELERSPGTNKQQLQQLAEVNNRLKTLRYQQFTMQSNHIDRYDTVQDSLLSVLRTVVSASSAPSSTVMNTLDTIGQYDGQVAGYRVQYDQAAKRFNNYLQLHQAQLQSLGGKYKQLAPLPLFELPQ
jgi:hypothetical protein